MPRTSAKHLLGSTYGRKSLVMSSFFNLYWGDVVHVLLEDLKPSQKGL